jgi:hypothetical protein
LEKLLSTITYSPGAAGLTPPAPRVGTVDELQVEEHHVGGVGERAVDRPAHRPASPTTVTPGIARTIATGAPHFRSILDDEYVHLGIRCPIHRTKCVRARAARAIGGR